MPRALSWLLTAGVASGVAAAGVATSTVFAAAWSLDGSRSWWFADARAVAGWLAGSALSVAAGVVAFAVGAGALWWSAQGPATSPHTGPAAEVAE